MENYKSLLVYKDITELELDLKKRVSPEQIEQMVDDTKIDIAVYPHQDRNFKTKGTELADYTYHLYEYIFDEDFKIAKPVEKNALTELLASQGYTVENLKDYYSGQNVKKYSKFLDSLLTELEFAPSNNIFLTYLLKVSIRDYFKIKAGNTITYYNGIAGLVDIENGSGSKLRIELEKPVIINCNLGKYSEFIQVDGADTHRYAIKDMYEDIEFKAEYKIIIK